MSELKAVHAFDVYEAYTKTGDDDAAQVYLKSEADKVIAALEKKLDIYKRGFKEDDKINAYLYVELRRQKYKRCLAMFDKCQVRVAYCQLLERYEQRNWWRKWMFKWLELADKLNEAK